MKYIFDQTAYTVTKTTKFDATNKARADVTRVMMSAGCEPFNIYVRKYKFPKLTSIIILIWYIRLLQKMKIGDVLYIQYPIKRSFLTYFYKILKILKYKKKVKLIFIVHDLDYIRLNSYMDCKEIILNPLRIADKIVAHTPAMRQHLEKEGIKSPISDLYLFDYLTADSLIEKDYCLNHKNVIVFAGNLMKSAFLKPLNECIYKYVRFRFYGLQPDMVFGEGKEYMGAFKPNNTSFIKGGWGLVWDGDSLEECSGLYGEYLRYNASHKLSLYITSGIPVIVWSQCGLASWIKEKKLGVAIDSLRDLDDAIANVTEQDYLEMLNCVRCQSLLLRSGQMLLNAI